MPNLRHDWNVARYLFGRQDVDEPFRGPQPRGLKIQRLEFPEGRVHNGCLTLPSLKSLTFGPNTTFSTVFHDKRVPLTITQIDATCNLGIPCGGKHVQKLRNVVAVCPALREVSIHLSPGGSETCSFSEDWKQNPKCFHFLLAALSFDKVKSVLQGLKVDFVDAKDVELIKDFGPLKEPLSKEFSALQVLEVPTGWAVL